MYISRRIRTFRNLIVQAHAQPTDWLIAVIRQPGPHQSRLATLACLRTVTSRIDTSGLCYRPRRQAVLARILAS